MELQSLLFLYLIRNKLTHYDFMPYLYGGFSIQAENDISALKAMGWLAEANEKFLYAGNGDSIDANLPFEDPGDSIKDQLPKERGNQLLKLVYEQYPYYAINSQIIESDMDKEGITRILNEKERLRKTEQILFTIGYEGLSLENYLNTLIRKDIHVLCDVRNNAFSRKFGFSKSILEKYLKDVGIEYIHLPELGIVAAKRNNISSEEDKLILFNDYGSSLPGRKKYLDRIIMLLKTKHRIALTCFEHEPMHCHRHIIRDYLKRNYNIKTFDLL